MKTLLTRSTLLLGLVTWASAYLASPALSQSATHPLFDMKCERGYYVGVLQNSDSGELFYRATGPSGSIGFGGGTTSAAMGKQIYWFQNGDYAYRVLHSIRGSGEGTLRVYKNKHSIMDLNCRQH